MRGDSLFYIGVQQYVIRGAQFNLKGEQLR